MFYAGTCPHIAPNVPGIGEVAASTALARESIKLSFRSELSTRGKARLRETARCAMWLPLMILSDNGIFPVKPLCPNWSVSKPENKEWR